MAKKHRATKGISININNSSGGQNPQSPSRQNYPDNIMDFIVKVVTVLLIQLIS